MRAQRRAGKPKLGQHLEWHGAKIRAVIRVPPSMKSTLGAHLRTVLPTDNPRLAEVLKLSAIQAMRAEIYRAKHGTKDDPLIKSALGWKLGIAEAAKLPDPLQDGQEPLHSALTTAMLYHAEDIAANEGKARAEMFTGIAYGVHHPIAMFLEDWIEANNYAPRSEASLRQAVTKLETWCKTKEDVPGVLEAITPRIAIRFIEEVFEKPQAGAANANKLISGLRIYWKWLLKRQILDPDTARNPWLETRIAKAKGYRNEEDTDKRPFTDLEATILLEGMTVQPVADMMRVSLATGMRLSEVAGLRVSHVQDGMIRVRIGKTRASRREFPAPSKLQALLARRMNDKAPDAYVFDDLPVQDKSARGRGAPASQTFTRERRKLGVDDVPTGAVQSRVDFHSCRRWFIRKAGEALVNGATGFTPWTIADVVGHDTKSDGPIPLTMGLYPGRANVDAMRACLEAVSLPGGGLMAYTAAPRKRGRPKTKRLPS
jgi:integrase